MSANAMLKPVEDQFHFPNATDVSDVDSTAFYCLIRFRMTLEPVPNTDLFQVFPVEGNKTLVYRGHDPIQLIFKAVCYHAEQKEKELNEL